MSIQVTTKYFRNKNWRAKDRDKPKEMELSHQYTHAWDVSDAVNYCPNCGANGTVYHELGPGDYYVGEEHICINCGAYFHIPDGVWCIRDTSDVYNIGEQQLRQLRENN